MKKDPQTEPPQYADLRTLRRSSTKTEPGFLDAFQCFPLDRDISRRSYWCPEEASHSSYFSAYYLIVMNLAFGKKPSKGPQKPSNTLVRCLFQTRNCIIGSDDKVDKYLLCTPFPVILEHDRISHNRPVRSRPNFDEGRTTKNLSIASKRRKRLTSPTSNGAEFFDANHHTADRV